MSDISRLVGVLTQELQAARSDGSVGVLAQFTNGALVQWAVDPANPGADGGPLMIVEVLSPKRLKRRQRARLAEGGWEKPRGPVMSNWWHLVGDAQEARLVAGQLVVLLPEVYEVEVSELFDLAAHPPEPAQAADPAVEWLTEVIDAWNDAAPRLGFPPCQSEAEDEYYAGDAYSPLSDYPVDGTEICADLVLLGSDVVLRFRVTPEGSSVPLEWVSPLAPDNVVLDREGDEGELRLDVELRATDDVTLLKAWETGLRSAMVAWAVDLPGQDTLSWDERDYGVPFHALLGDKKELEPPIATIATLIGVGAAYVTEVRPPASTSFMVGYDDDGSVPDMEMLMAVASVANDSDEMTNILGLWLSGAVSDREGRQIAAQQRLVDLVPGLAVEVGANGPSWTFSRRPVTASAPRASDQSLRQLGWQPRSHAPTEYELPTGLEMGRAGEIVARTITGICNLLVRDLFWEMLEIGDATQRLRRFADTGWI